MRRSLDVGLQLSGVVMIEIRDSEAHVNRRRCAFDRQKRKVACAPVGAAARRRSQSNVLLSLINRRDRLVRRL